MGDYLTREQREVLTGRHPRPLYRSPPLVKGGQGRGIDLVSVGMTVLVLAALVFMSAASTSQELAPDGDPPCAADPALQPSPSPSWDPSDYPEWVQLPGGGVIVRPPIGGGRGVSAYIDITEVAEGVGGRTKLGLVPRWYYIRADGSWVLVLWRADQ